MNKIFSKQYRLFWILFPAIIIVDRITKILAVKFLSGGGYVPVLGEFAGFELVYNDGAAWNLLSGNRLLLSSISFVAAILIAIYLFRNKFKPLGVVGFSMVIAGAIGNGIDRAVSGKVIDMIRVNIFAIFNSNFPIFNVADLAVTFGAALVVIYFIFFEKD